MHGQRAAIVGGTGGLGRAIARWLAAQGAAVTVVGRTFRDSDTDGIDFIRADLSTVSEQRRVASELPAEDLDLLVFTTGILPMSGVDALSSRVGRVRTSSMKRS